MFLVVFLPTLFVLCFQEAQPIRLKGIHFINEPTVIGYIWSILRQFLKEKTANRVNRSGAKFDWIVIPFSVSFSIF